MSEPSEQPTAARQWLPRLLSGQPHQVIGGPADPYLRRWYVIPRNPVLNVYVHQFLRSDDDRALHDHPWWFVSLILKGGYNEIAEKGNRTRRAGSIAFRPATWRHRVVLWITDEDDGRSNCRQLPCWTLIVTGRRSRTWGFWCKRQSPFLQRVVGDRFVPWTQWGDAGCGER